MKNTIYDYIDWRGDLSPINYPFNEVDYLILSELSYVHLDHITEISYETPLTLKEVFDIYQKRNSLYQESTLKSIYNESHFLFEKMAKSIRYQNIKIINYTNEIDKDLIKQFSATSFILEDETLCVSYRGTDDNLIGWHEDFLMLCENIVPSQISSVEYLNQVAQYSYQDSILQALKNKKLGSTILERFQKHRQYKKGRPIMLVGHSKGGNLAMYAGCFCQTNIKQRIKHIYNYDGPGFQNEIIASLEYKSMLPRIHSFLPHYSFFGIVLGHEESYSVIHSHYLGMLQHNGFSWDVSSQGFIEDELSFESTQFAIKVILFLEKLTYEEKKEFVAGMFNLFYSLGLYTFSDLSNISYKHILNAIKELTLLNSSLRKSLLEVLHMLWLEARKTKTN